tara:strand:- start:4365 stop:5024 length:660 start_codon:yes stop_codon:yes gene_type:complete
MQFDAKRLSVLAGISAGGSLLSESAEGAHTPENIVEGDESENDLQEMAGEYTEDVEPVDPMDEVDEAMHNMEEDPDEAHCTSEADDADDDGTDEGYGMMNYEGAHDEDLQELGNRRKRDEMGDEDEHGHQLAEDTVYEIDEGMLRRELAIMKQEREQALAEARVREVIRHEIGNIFQQISPEDLNLGASWVYGKDKPRVSKAGQLWVGGPGIGFKGFKK